MDGRLLDRSGRRGVALSVMSSARYVLQVERSIQEFVVWQNLLWMELYGKLDRRPMLVVGRERALLSLPGAKGWGFTFHEQLSNDGSFYLGRTRDDVEILHLSRGRNGGPNPLRVVHGPSGVTVIVDNQATTAANEARALVLLAEQLDEENA